MQASKYSIVLSGSRNDPDHAASIIATWLTAGKASATDSSIVCGNSASKEGMQCYAGREVARPPYGNRLSPP